MTLTACTIQGLKDALRLHVSGDLRVETATSQPKPSIYKPVILVFSGQMGQRPVISKQVYQHSNLLQQHLDRCDQTPQCLRLESLFPYIFIEHKQTDARNYLIRNPCAIFAIKYAVVLLWLDASLHMSKMVGHSLGQLTALCVGGALSLYDALRLLK